MTEEQSWLASWKRWLSASFRRLGYEIRRVPKDPDERAAQPDERHGRRPANTGSGRPEGFPARRAALQRLDGMTSMRQLERLYALAREVSDGCIVEVGSYRGRSTAALAFGSLDGHGAPVFAIEPHETVTGVFGGQFGPRDRAAFFNALLATGTWEVVRLVNLSSEVVTPGWTRPVELLWLDGDHSYEGVARDFKCWEPYLTARSTVALDDTAGRDAGPTRLVAELVATGRWQVGEVVGKMTVLRPQD